LPLPLEEAIENAHSLAESFTVLEDGPNVWREFGSLTRRFTFGGRQVYDAHIVATMLAYGERRLLTFNEADFRRFRSVIDIVVP
jgi:predicted nucleic acid-binding protein